MDLEVSGCDRIAKYMCRLVFDVGRLRPVYFCNRLGVPKNYFVLRRKYTRAETISRCPAEKDVDKWCKAMVN